ncbi:unnamed protein product [Effrenium voratum]|nr:unnamed protein product [Effrenium voratum]
MLGLWASNPCCSPAPALEEKFGPNMRVPDAGAGFTWPAKLSDASNGPKRQRPAQAERAELSGPISPVWCPVPSEPSQLETSTASSVDFLGKWFLRHAPEKLQQFDEVEEVSMDELQRLRAEADKKLSSQLAQNSLGWWPPPVDPVSKAPTGLRSFVVHEDPRMVAVPQFLSKEECDHLCELAQGSWIRSLVGKFADPAAGQTDKVATAEARTRTSSSCPLRPAQTVLVQRIEQRLAQLAKLPLENLERLVVVRYEPGQEFSLHHDGKFRPTTVFIYLNELPDNAGGDTFFPHLGFSFVPRTGCAVMWPNAQEDGSEDSRMVHAGRPPATGVKFGVNCFFNVDVKRVVSSPSMTVAAEECPAIDIASLEGDRGTSERSRTFSLGTEPALRVVPSFLTPEEAEDFEAKGRPASSSFQGSTVTLRTFGFQETPLVAQVEERLTEWNEFAAANLGSLRLVRGNTGLGMGNRGCGQRSASICLSEKAEAHFPHLGVRVVMQRGDLLEWPNAWFQSETAKEKITVEDLRTSHVHLIDAVLLDASFHDKRRARSGKAREAFPS